MIVTNIKSKISYTIKSIIFLCLFLVVTSITSYGYEPTVKDPLLSESIETDHHESETNKNHIVNKEGTDYIVDVNGKEQVILNDIKDAAVGEVAYFGHYDKEKIPFVVVRRNNRFVEIMSLPKFNIELDKDVVKEYDIVEAFYVRDSVLLKKIFNNNEIKKMIPFRVKQKQLGIDNKLLKEFKIDYDKNLKKDVNPTILTKILPSGEYTSLSGYDDNWITELSEDGKIVGVTEINNMRNCIVKNAIKGITYSYNYDDYVFQTGVDRYKKNSHITLRLKNVESDVYKEKVNGFKHIAEGSDLDIKDFGYYYFKDGQVITKDFLEMDGVKYYLSDNGKAIELKKFKTQKLSGVKVLIYEDVIIKDKIINKDEIATEDTTGLETNRYYVDVNGIVHNLIDDIKNAVTSDTVCFGHKKDNPEEPLLWRVVENNSGVYTLILEHKIKLDIINDLSYRKERSEGVYDGKISVGDSSKSYVKSDRRKYLNEIFYNESFNEGEKELIVYNPIRFESFIGEKNFTPLFYDEDVYDKVFIYTRDTKEYMKTYSSLFEMLKVSKPSIYNDEDLDLNFSLSDSDMRYIRPWVVVNISGENMPPEDNTTNYVGENLNHDNLSIDYGLLGRIEFGSYGDYVLEWRMIAADGDTAYFQATSMVDFERIVESKNKEIKWSNSELRKWLNQVLLNRIFDFSEQMKLEKIKKKYKYIDVNGYIKEEECEDKMTLLSYDEIPIYSGPDFYINHKVTEKINLARENGSIDGNEIASATSFFDNTKHKFYSACSEFDEVCDRIVDKVEVKTSTLDYIGVVPVIAIKIDKLKDIKMIVKSSIKKRYKDMDELIKAQTTQVNPLLKDGLYGDVIKFGKYQNKDMEWFILDRRFGYALVMAKESLFTDNNLGRYGLSLWETSNVRKKLNTEIYNECFTDGEKKRIKPVWRETWFSISETKDPDDLTETKRTLDYMFLPEQHDEIHFITKSPLKTIYREDELLWLRDGDSNGFFVSRFGELEDMDIDRKNNKYNVRPLMWIKYE